MAGDRIAVHGGFVLRLIGIAGVALALSACEGVKKQFGMTKQSPDEFRVVARAPLTLPPNFVLRPPQPGAVRPQEGSATDQARQAVLGASQSNAGGAGSPVASDGLSPGQYSLLKATGAEKADPNIRLIVDGETKQLNAADGEFLEFLVFWRDKDRPGVIIDANAESRRLRENMALGKDISTGVTPTIERRKKALFEGIF